MSKSTEWGAFSLTSWQNPEGHCRYHLQWDHSLQVPTSSEEDHNFCQGWGEGNTSYRTTSFGLLSTAQDSELKVDLGKQLMFPETAAMAKARHGSDLRSLQADHPFRTHSSLGGSYWGDQWEEENQVYQTGRRVPEQWLVSRHKPIEVGCRAFVSKSLCRVYDMLGIRGASRQWGIKSAMEATEVPAWWLWVRRQLILAGPSGKGCMVVEKLENFWWPQETSLMMMCPGASLSDIPYVKRKI